MTKLKLILTLIVLTGLVSCGNKKHVRKNEIKRVAFATGGCYGSCPIQSIDIDSTFTFKYHGVRHTDKTGFYVGRVTRGFWDTLNIKLENVNYRQLDTAYDYSVDDLSTEIFIYYNDKVKHIHGQSTSLPDSVMGVYNWFLKSIEKLEMNPTKDSLKFQTIIEKSVPKPALKSIKFPPPTVDDK